MKPSFKCAPKAPRGQMISPPTFPKDLGPRARQELLGIFNHCQVNEGLNLPSAMNRSYGAETQPEPSVVDSKIRNETHGLIVYNIPEILEGTPVESRTHDVKAISDVFKRILAPSDSVKILQTFRLRNIKRPKAYTDTPCPIKVILSSATGRDLILSRKSILRSQTNVFFKGSIP